MPNPFEQKRILLGVTGSIAAYKAADLASKLKQAGALVDVVLTGGAQHFISALTFQSVTGRKAYTDEDLWGGEGHVTHIGLGRAAELIVIAPASANTIAKLAQGMGDNLLTVTVLASNCPVVIAPAMDAGMFSHAATQANVEVLKRRGVTVIGPAAGHLASGLVGVGRMTEPHEILGGLRYVLSRGGPLAGKKVIVTAGGTQEPIDPVRVITNRSSGKQGYAVAQAALDAGADVTLISGPTQISAPVGVEIININTAAEMQHETLRATAKADALIMAAAVADFRPVEPAPEKIKKQQGLPVLELESTQDILAEVAVQRQKAGFPRCVIGFAAESQELRKNALSKLEAKNLDMIVGNDITAPDSGFEVNTNRVTFFFASGKSEDLPTLSKDEVAEAILQRAIAILNTAK